MKIEGHIDRWDASGLDGWVLDHDNPEVKLQLAVSWGTALLGTCIADQFRKDLADSALGDGCCAFRFELPRRLSATELPGLNVSVIGTDYIFRFGLGPSLSSVTAGELYEQVATELRRSGRQRWKFKMCILHIGTEKTGSTSLQTCLGLNRAIFADSGYFIPRSLAFPLDDTSPNHTHIAMISMNEEKFDDGDLRRQCQVLDRAGLNRFRRNLFASFSAEIAAAPEAYHTLLLSNEHCHSRLVTPEEVQNLRDFLDHFCEAYRVVVYLRPQHELAMSQYGMFVANGISNIDMFPPFPPPPDYKKVVYTSRTYFDYRALLDRWSQVFGEDALHPRIYAGEALRGGDVVNDFTSDLSLTCGNIVLPPRSNANTSARGQAFLIEFYRALGDVKRFGAAMLRERVRSAVVDCFPGPGRAPARGEVAAFLQNFEEDNEVVRSRWFPERRRLFEVDLEGYPEDGQTLTLSPEQMMGMFVELLLKDQEMRFRLTPEALRRIEEGLSPCTE